MHFCRICRTEKNLKYTVKELRKFSRRRCNDKLLCTTPTLGNICHECEERLHNFNNLDEHGDNEERIIVDDDELLYNLFFERMDQQRLMNCLMVSDSAGSVGDVGVGGEWRAANLRQQTLVAATAGVTLNSADDVIEVLTSRENTPSPSLPSLGTCQATEKSQINESLKDIGTSTANLDTTNINITATNAATKIPTTATTTNIVTPSSDINKISPYKVVAVIDLDDDDDGPIAVPATASTPLLTPPQTTPESDEEIVFRKVEVEDAKIINKHNKRNNKRSLRKFKYQNRQINLIASLSLVSSDSEVDVEVTDAEKSPTKPNNSPNSAHVTNASISQLLTPSKCSTSDTSKLSPTKITTPSSKESTQDQIGGDSLDKCPVCHTGFATSQRLVHHMRRKHRSYDGDVLSERPRCAQDSAMTIRLRYIQRYNYYECQLCGCIDAIFKIHKQHIIQEHPEESKCLKDPMMQTLKCPLCKEKCGTQHSELLRHMLQAHRAAECRTHFRQVSHKHNMFTNCSAKKEKELQRTARIYQITKRKQYFFECIQCHKIVTGYFNHLKHQNSHCKKINNKKNAAPADSAKNDSPKIAATATPTLTPDPVTRRVKQSSIEKKMEKTPTLLPIKDKNSIKKKPSLPQNQQKTAQKTVQQQQQQQSRRDRKLSKKAIQAALVKVKVKPPLKQFPTQRYNCNLCNKSFKGFHRLNLHKLRFHACDVNDNDGSVAVLRCSVCLLRFSDHIQLKKHEETRHLCKQKRKATTTVVQKAEKYVKLNGQIESEPHNTTPAKHIDSSEIKDNVNNVWLQELIALAIKHQNQQKICRTANKDTYNLMETYQCKDDEEKDNAVSVSDEIEHKNKQNLLSSTISYAAAEQCLYCGHLFRTVAELHSHEHKHVQQQEAKKIKHNSGNLFMIAYTSS